MGLSCPKIIKSLYLCCVFWSCMASVTSRAASKWLQRPNQTIEEPQKLPQGMGTLLSKPPPPGSQLVLPSEEATHLPHVVVQRDVLRVLPQAVLPPLRAGAAAGPAAAKHTAETRVRRKAGGKAGSGAEGHPVSLQQKKVKPKLGPCSKQGHKLVPWPPHGKPPGGWQTNTHPRDKNPKGNVPSCLPGPPVRAPGTWNAGHATALMPSLGKSLC